MFPSLNELIGWGRGIDEIPVNTAILLGDSNPLDTLPFIYTFMNHWLKSSTTALQPITSTPSTAVIFVSFKTSQTRLVNTFRKLYSIQLNLLSAQSRFFFIDAVDQEESTLFTQISEAAKRVNQECRTLVILEGFAWCTSLSWSLADFTRFYSKIEELIRLRGKMNVFIQWSRDLESDYPGRSKLLREDIRLGGPGWMYLLSQTHFVFCARPLRSGMSHDAIGEIVAAFGVQTSLLPTKPSFHPLISLYKMASDTSIQCFTKGTL